jgi:uncharacterized LabA/DUF88 family protein
MEITRADRRLAMLIDADNASPTIITGLLAEISKYGVATIKRIYGDWTTPNLTGWKNALLEHSIIPIQQFRYTVRKNATDCAMIIDAMDILYGGKTDGFCLVSSDSDFTRLAARIRESGHMVYGFGERKTPMAFVSACDKFTFVDIFTEPANADAGVNAPARAMVALDKEISRLLSVCVQSCANEDGWTNLADVGAQIASQKPDFDSRHYGYPKLSALVESTGAFELRREPVGIHGQTIMVLVRAKR